MRRTILFSVFAAVATISTSALAQPRTSTPPATINANCPGFYADGRAPETVAAPARSGGRIICHSFYVINYATNLRDPLWTSYRLTRDMARGGDAITRYNGNFRQEPGLSASLQGAHRDYVSPPYDRGHLTPANDAVDMPSQRDTFVITNVVPQIGEFNRGLWRFLESSVHQLAEDEGEVFIVTGAVFAASPPIMQRPGQAGRIAVPEATFKAIYVPSRGIAVGYYATNQAATVCTTMSIDDLARRTGVNAFPSLPAAVRRRLPAFTLPAGAGTPVPDCRP